MPFFVGRFVPVSGLSGFCSFVVSVDRHTSHETCLSTYSSPAQSAHMHIHSPRERTRALVSLKGSLSSQRHVSYLAALVAEHIYTSLTYLTSLPFVISLSQSLTQAPCTCADPRRSGGSHSFCLVVSSFAAAAFFEKALPSRKGLQQFGVGWESHTL